MKKTETNFFSSILKCLRRTKEQREFEEELYRKGLENEQTRMIQKLNEIITSKEFAVKFVLQELDVARKGDTFLQYFVKKSGFHVSEYSGALEKFQQEQEEIEKIQFFFLDFLNKISDEKVMYQTAMNIINGVMEHWKIGKYSKEREVLLEEEMHEESYIEEDRGKSPIASSIKALKSSFMDKLVIVDDKIQNILDTFNAPKEEVKKEALNKEESRSKESKEASEEVVKIYTDDYIDALMEKHSKVIQEIIIGDIHPENSDEVQMFQAEMSLATLEGHNLATVFCTFFETESTVAITEMDDVSKEFFIKILNTFEAYGFSDSLQTYLKENRESVYVLATEGDMFMQYLLAFWYVLEEEEQYLWYNKSALNGFKLAIERIEKIRNHKEER